MNIQDEKCGNDRIASIDLMLLGIARLYFMVN